MIVDPQAFLHLSRLADQLEDGANFESNTREFIEWAAWLKEDLRRQSRDPEVLEQLDLLPEIETQAYQRSFLEQMLPKSHRNMVGKYKNREIIREKVRETLRIFTQLKRF